MQFPDQFLWGVGTSAYQIEGAASDDGRGLSVWDLFCTQDGAITDGSSGARACNHYWRALEDVALMSRMGLNLYRFSVSWPRVLPNGRKNSVNPQGLQFYDRLVDALLAANITPMVTLFHWDYPAELFHQGGWLHPDSPEWFADYADLIARTLGDRVRYWITLNEPRVFLELGHKQGIHAPGLKLSDGDFLTATRHTFRGHGLAVRAIRAAVPRPASIGVAFGSEPAIPAGKRPEKASAEDVEAARNWMFSPDDIDCDILWMDPLLRGRAPERGPFAVLTEEDLRIAHQPLDFCGMNVYTGTVVAAGNNVPAGSGGSSRTAGAAAGHAVAGSRTAAGNHTSVVGNAAAGSDVTPVELPFPEDHPRSAFGWPIVPEELYWAPRFSYERYGLPIFVTENGMSTSDMPDATGVINDRHRVSYIRDHLTQLARAIADGTPVLGYSHWSLLDNFEWAAGYTKWFGLTYVDFETGRRTLKRSGLWYADVVQRMRGGAGSGG